MMTGPGRPRSAELATLYEVFAQQGFSSPCTIETPDYVFAGYPTIETRSLALNQSPDGDFVFVCGTCLDDDGVGCAAATHLAECRTNQNDRRLAIMGHYAVVLRRCGRTVIRVDNFGGYQLYYNNAAGIVATSFLALCSVLPRLTLSQQSACEYVFNGVVSGNETLFGEVAVAPIGATIRVGPRSLDIARPKLAAPRSLTAATRAQSIDCSVTLLDRYFGAVRRIFGDRVGCALSGGYDSRLILAFSRRHGIRPRVYVYGKAADSDVAIAKEIAAGEGFELAAIDKNDRPVIAPETFADTAYRNFLTQDGYGWGGIFQNGAELAESARRVRGDTIALNGGGGEIFRNFFYLSDRDYSIRELLWCFYSRFDPAVLTKVFDPGGYYRGLEKKVGEALGSDDPRLPRTAVEWLYHRFRCRSWDGKTDSLAARFGPTGMPYLEPAVTEHASILPLHWKNHGDYEAELIRRADCRLAAYRSVYGHDFAAPAPFPRRLLDYATYLRPPWLRRYAYRLKYRRRWDGSWLGYLARAYREAVLPDGLSETGRLFRAERVVDPDQYARILSLEYALRHLGSRIRLEF
jgi:hypothetical protein